MKPKPRSWKETSMPDKPNTNKLRKASSGTPKPGPMPTQHASVPSNPQTPPQEIHKVASMDNYPGGLGGMRTAPMPVVEQSQAAKITPYSRIGSKPAPMPMPKGGSWSRSPPRCPSSRSYHVSGRDADFMRHAYRSRTFRRGLLSEDVESAGTQVNAAYAFPPITRSFSCTRTNPDVATLAFWKRPTLWLCNCRMRTVAGLLRSLRAPFSKSRSPKTRQPGTDGAVTSRGRE